MVLSGIPHQEILNAVRLKPDTTTAILNAVALVTNGYCCAMTVFQNY
jgi:hypothetical protein